MINWSNYFDWAYSGVNISLPSSGGPSCINYLQFERKFAETVGFVIMSLTEICFAWPRLNLPTKMNKPEESASRSLVLAILAVTFGVEVGFKLATRQFIWLLNPCHLITAVQIFLFAAPPGKIVIALFRIHLYYLIGPIEALLFPVTHSRKHVFEREVYFIQHVLIIIVPHYLIKSRGMFTPEPISDLSWPLMAFGTVFLFHFTILQYLSTVTQVNINNIMCPASADPFRGQWYRVAAVCHQTFLMFIVGKLYPCISDWLSFSWKTLWPVSNTGQGPAKQTFLRPCVTTAGLLANGHNDDDGVGTSCRNHFSCNSDVCNDKNRDHLKGE